jgi:hypothetical protein
LLRRSPGANFKETCMPPSSDRPSDELIFQHLGAAVVLCWAQLPPGAREQILRQADDVIGLAPIPEIRTEIVKLLLRRAKAQWVAAFLSFRTAPNDPVFRGH